MQTTVSSVNQLQPVKKLTVRFNSGWIETFPPIGQKYFEVHEDQNCDAGRQNDPFPPLRQAQIGAWIKVSTRGFCPENI